MYQGEHRGATLSVVIIAKDEADRIARCLASVEAIADEIIVLDSGSSDDTVSIARQFTPDVHETDWPGYGKQKQRAVSMATGDWVLSLDADEELTVGMREEVNAIVCGNGDHDAYKVRWAVMLLDKQLNYGANSRYVLRLFRRGSADFTDADVHEAVKLNPGTSLGKLTSRLRHYSMRDFDHMMQKYDHYASLGARMRHEKGRTGGGLFGAAFRGVFVFLQLYIFRLGFLDGGPGFLIAVMHSQYAFNKYAGLWYLNQQDRMK